MEEQKNNKRMLNIELDDDVKRVSITGIGSDEKVVMKQELDEEDLKQATGGTSHSRGINLTGKTEGYMCYSDGYCNKHITRYGINKCRNKTIQV
jgi:hypothetical protein